MEAILRVFSFEYPGLSFFVKPGCALCTVHYFSVCLFAFLFCYEVCKPIEIITYSSEIKRQILWSCIGCHKKRTANLRQSRGLAVHSK